MDRSCLEYRLTAQEREQFEREGYLIVKEALSPPRIEALIQEVDGIHAKRVQEGFSPMEALFYPDFIPDSALFQELVAHPRLLPKVWGILGWNIYLYHAHLIVTPNCGRPQDGKTFGWHQDSGRVNQEVECHPRPRLSIKVAYFLSDCSEPGRGNFWVIPGSHLQDSLERPADGMGQPQGAIPVCVEPGSAVIFDRRIWHTATPNWSNVTRKVLFYGYGYRWIRTKDNMTVQTLWESSSPIQRQLLGWGVNCNGFFSPTDEDVPLRVWLQENSPEEAK